LKRRVLELSRWIGVEKKKVEANSLEIERCHKHGTKKRVRET